MEATEQTQTPEMVDQAVENHESKSPKESFAELRKAKDNAEREAWQARKELELLKQMQLQVQQPKVSQEDHYDYRQLANEEFPDGKNVVRALDMVDKKLSSYEQKLQERDIKIQALEFAVEHADFKDVVTAENIEKYIKSDEDNREAVERASNPLSKVYRLIKKSAAYQADLAAKTTKPVSQEQKRIEDKEGKPKLGSMGVRSDAVTAAAQISNSKMSRQQKQALWQDTLNAARR